MAADTTAGWLCVCIKYFLIYFTTLIIICLSCNSLLQYISSKNTRTSRCINATMEDLYTHTVYIFIYVHMQLNMALV